MATIKEIASRYSGATENEKAYFEMGANMVLNEIESIINTNKVLGNPFSTLDERYFCIVDKIKELKGE